MAATKYYPEDELVEKFQSGEYGWIDYVNHHSPEWQEEYTAFCMAGGIHRILQGAWSHHQ